MANACEMYGMSKDLDYKHPGEDTGEWIPVSWVRLGEECDPDEAVQDEDFEGMAEQVIFPVLDAVKLGVSVIGGISLWSTLSEMLFAVRGYQAIGSELLFSAAFAGALWYAMDKLEERYLPDMFGR